MGLPTATAILLLTTTPVPQVADVAEPAPTASDAVVEAAEAQSDPPANEASAARDPAARPEEESEQETPPDTPGTIIVTGEGQPGDPLGAVNQEVFEISQQVDRVLVEPIAVAYEEDIPKPVRFGLRNFFRNLREPVNALNYLLQLKPGKAAETLGRFAINSTIGVGGLVDVAKREPFGLPYRRNSFGDTLGYYGVGPGPFFVLPLIGSTTLRDLFGSGLDQAIIPTAIGKPFNTPYYAVPAYTVTSLEFRIEYDDRLDEINQSVDPYWAARETYLCQREADIAALKNRPPPRDCSVEALLAAEDVRMGFAPNPDAQEQPEEAAPPAPEAEVIEQPGHDDTIEDGAEAPPVSMDSEAPYIEAALLPFEDSVAPLQ